MTRPEAPHIVIGMVASGSSGPTGERSGSAAAEPDTRESLQVLSVTTMFPSSGLPRFGVFVRHRLRWVASRARLVVASGVPVFPLATRLLARYRPRLRIGRQEIHGDGPTRIDARYPRFLSIPALLKPLDGLTLALSLARLWRRLNPPVPLQVGIPRVVGLEVRVLPDLEDRGETYGPPGLRNQQDVRSTREYVVRVRSVMTGEQPRTLDRLGPAPSDRRIGDPEDVEHREPRVVSDRADPTAGNESRSRPLLHENVPRP